MDANEFKLYYHASSLKLSLFNRLCSNFDYYTGQVRKRKIVGAQTDADLSINPLSPIQNSAIEASAIGLRGDFVRSRGPEAVYPS